MSDKIRVLSIIYERARVDSKLGSNCAPAVICQKSRRVRRKKAPCQPQTLQASMSSIC